MAWALHAALNHARTHVGIASPNRIDLWSRRCELSAGRVEWGADTHPLWYLNLVTTPGVELQVGAKTFTAVARTATPEEKAHLWPIMTTIFPQYTTYQAKAKRDIPLVIVEPDEHP